MRAKILVIDDEKCIRITFGMFLSDEGYEVHTAGGYDEALTAIAARDYDLIFADILLGDKTGIDMLKEIKKMNLNCPVVMITGVPNLETAEDALRLGAFDYIHKPVEKNDLLHAANRALQHKSLLDKNEKYRSNLEAIFRSVKDAIITIDKDLSIIEMNEAAEKICMLSRDSIGKPFNSFLSHCSGKCYKILQETFEKKESVEIYHVECPHIHRSNKVVTLIVSPLLDVKGTFSGAVMVIRDETRLVNLERDLRERQQFHKIIGRSDKMQRIYSLIEDLSDIQTTILITGESGTGKELIAEAIHYTGIRGDKPLIKVNCSALSEDLLESELFGHIKGAFTGAIKDRLGRFQMADGGTIFLDEIGDISPKIQLKLLRVLQEMEIEPVGDSTPLKVDVRVVAATNQNLKEKVKSGKFREDLYYRLKVIELNLPPLRERREDIPLLMNHFLKKLNEKLDKKITAVSKDVKEIFTNYNWHGNIRELEHVLESAVISCTHNIIELNNLPFEFKKVKQTFMSDKNEYQAILQALDKTAWNKAKAARLLGMSRQSIYNKMKEYKVKRDNS